MGVNSLPKTVTRQHRDCDLNPGPSAPESSTLTTRLPSHPVFDAEQNDPGIRQLTPMCPHLIYFGPLESAARTASRSVQPLLQGCRSRLTDQHTTVAIARVEHQEY